MRVQAGTTAPGATTTRYKGEDLLNKRRGSTVHHPHSKDAVIAAMKDLGTAAKYDKLRPRWQQIERRVVSRKATRQRVETREFTSINDDGGKGEEDNADADNDE